MNRYESYIDTEIDWIGKIPTSWTLSRVGKFFTERSDKVDDVLYPPLSVTMSGIVDQLSDVAKTDDNKNRKLVREGDFVINSRSDRKGSSGISPRDGSVSLINIVLEPCGIEPQFIQHLFKSYFFKEEFFRHGRGIHWDLWTTHWVQFKTINIPIPSMKEQKLISRYLDKKTKQIDLLIGKLKKKIEILKEKQISLINQCVTRGLNLNVKMKDSGIEWIGLIPKHWEYLKLKFVSTHISEKRIPMDGDIKISPENVESHTGKILNFYSDCESKGYVFSKGDILFNKLRVYLNKVVLCDFEGLSMGEMIVIRPKDISGSYLHRVLNSAEFIDHANSLSRGVKMPRSPVEGIFNLFVPVPRESEQEEIAAYLDSSLAKFDNLVEKYIDQINLISEYRQSLISEVVTGKVRVTEDMI